MRLRPPGRFLAALVAGGSLVAACGSGTSAPAPGLDDVGVDAEGAAGPPAPLVSPGTDGTLTPPPTSSTTTSTRRSTTTRPTSSTTSTTSSTTTTTATTTSSSSTTSSTTSTSTTTTVEPAPPASSQPPPGTPGAGQAFVATGAVFDRLAAANTAVSLTVLRDDEPAVALATGRTIEGSPATSDSPMVVASVTKLATALAIIRFDTVGVRALDRPVPWNAIGVAHDPAWADVSARELLDHTSGMPVARSSWFDDPGTCASHLPALMAGPPGTHRGRWTYSNGNYCALGLLVEQLAGMPLGAALDSIVFAPVGATGAHLTTDGQRPGDVAYPLGVDRLSRLGGAGTLIASTDDLALVLSELSRSDLDGLRWPGVFIDQYGFGHTGTVDGAKACAWVLRDGRTVVAATVSGNTPQTGGELCDLVVPAVAADLGMAAGRPERTPPGPPPAR